VLLRFNNCNQGFKLILILNYESENGYKIDRSDRSCFFGLIYKKNSKHNGVFVYFWIEDKQLYLITKVYVQKVTEFKSFGFG
jgi:hypothetical protein